MTEVTADTIAVRVLFEAEQAQRHAQAYGASVHQAMAKVEIATTKAAGATADAATKQGEAYRSLGRSLSGAAADAIEGKNAFAILGQHGTEVASAFTHLGGTVGRVATFLSGPWGVAINTAVAVGGLLASKLLDAASALRGANDLLADVAAKGEALLDAAEKADAAALDAGTKGREAIGTARFNERMADVTKAIEAARGASEALARDLSTGLTQAILKGENLGDVLKNAFLKAGAAAIQSRIFDLLTTGEIGGLFKSIGTFVGGPAAAREPGRASGGHVSAGQLYRVNELGIEGFRPAGSGTIVPLGRMAAARAGGGVTVVQPLNVSFAGAITTPELMAEFKAYADGVGQAAAIGGAAMAQSRMARRAVRTLPR